jgi:surface antigen
VRVWAGRPVVRRVLYRGTAALRLCGSLRRLAAVAAAAGALALCGCSYQLDSMLSKTDADPSLTGLAGRAGAQQDRTAVSEADLAFARAAAGEALARGGSGNSVPWRNPQTGVGGNITPLAVSYSTDGLPCRDFLASYMSGSAQAWLHGSACRTAAGQWQVKSLTPLKSG